MAIARLRSSSSRRTIKLLADFGRDWPLWEDDDENDAVNLLTSPDDYGLSDELTLRMRVWFDFWAAHYDPDSMWNTSANHARWHQDGRAIASAMRAEVRDFADVKFL
ncbi:hypothetical protein BH09ACT4_BH09ACT4_18450 [soil metagenome]